MRHLKSGNHLGVKPAHKRAMMRNMVTSLLEHGRIATTVARAKEVPIKPVPTIAIVVKGSSENGPAGSMRLDVSIR